MGVYDSNYSEYVVVLDRENFTYEAGIIKFDLTFANKTANDGTDEGSTDESYFRIATGGTIEISPCEDWDSTMAYSYIQEKLARLRTDISDIQTEISDIQNTLNLFRMEMDTKATGEIVDCKIQDALDTINGITSEEIDGMFESYNLV